MSKLNHQYTPERLPASRAKRGTPKNPKNRMRLLPLAIVGLLVAAAPATAQLSALGQATGSVQGEVDLPDLPQPHLSASAELQKQISVRTPQIELGGHTYFVLSLAQMAAVQAHGSTHFCSDVSSRMTGPAGLSSYAEVCGYLNATAVFVDSVGLVQAVMISDAWLTIPSLHREVTLDIAADASSDVVYEQTGWIEASIEAAGSAIASSAQSMGAYVAAHAEATANGFLQAAQEISAGISASAQASARVVFELF